VIGHMPLIRIRMARKAPKAVWVWVGIGRDFWASHWEEFSDLYDHPEVVMEAKDNPKFLDLRFMKNLQVHVDGNESTARILDVHVACLKAGAKDVFTFHKGELIWDKGEDYAPIKG
jgi:hypothetical protein